MNNLFSKQAQESDSIALVGPILKGPIPAIPYPQVAVDGGAAFSLSPVLWVGDGDSGTTKVGVPALKKTSDNITDLVFCLIQIDRWKWTQLHLYGFLGARRDHELANFGEVCQMMKTRAETVRAIFYHDESEAKIFIYQAGLHSIEVQGLFSILVFETTRLTISGACQYPVSDQFIGAFSGRGVSNQGSGTITIQSANPFLLLIGDGIA